MQPKERVLTFAVKHTETFKTIWRCIETFSSNSQQVELLKSVNKLERNLLCFTVINKEVFEFLLKVAQEIMEPSEFFEMLIKKNFESNNILHCISKSEGYSAFIILWSAVEEKISNLEQRKQLLTDVGFGGRNILQKGCI